MIIGVTGHKYDRKVLYMLPYINETRDLNNYHMNFLYIKLKRFIHRIRTTKNIKRDIQFKPVLFELMNYHSSKIKVNPWFLRYLRTFFKIFFIFSKKRWKLFDKKYFFYWIDNFCGYAPVKYSKVITDKRIFRNSFSWSTWLYLKKKFN